MDCDVIAVTGRPRACLLLIAVAACGSPRAGAERPTPDAAAMTADDVPPPDAAGARDAPARAPDAAALATPDAPVDSRALAPDVAPADAAGKGYEEMKIYDGPPPNFLATAPPEREIADGHIYDVSIPTLRRFPRNDARSTGMALVVFPGGAYTALDFATHATSVADRLGPQGVAVFGLKYRVGNGSKDVPRDALLDAKRAVRFVRAHAAEWGIARDRIGVVSYSAGSHLALTLIGSFDDGQPAAADPIERIASRPDFLAAMCPWAYGQAKSPFTFSARSSPVFMCHAQDDTTAPIALSYAIQMQLQALRVPVHLEVYPTGGHAAFNVEINPGPGRDWPDKFMTWLRDNRLVP